MIKKKAVAIVISMVLILTATLPSTFAASIDQDSVSGESGASAAATEAAIEGESIAVCTCDPQPAEGEAHMEGCPFYVAPAASVAVSHIESCSDDCSDVNCKCDCHLFNRIMACQTLDEIWQVMGEASETAILALTDAQNEQINAKIEALEPDPAPAVVPDEGNDAPVQSEIVYQTVNYTYVAPFGEPVTGERG